MAKRGRPRETEVINPEQTGEMIIIGGIRKEFTPELLDVKQQYDKMTDLQKKWFDAYLTNRDGTLSAKIAGYSGGRTTLAHVGSMNKEKMQHMLDVMDTHAKEVVQAVSSLTEIYRFWGETLVDQSHSMTNRLKASELLARALGAFDNENGELNININTDKFDEIDVDVLEAFIINHTSQPIDQPPEPKQIEQGKKKK